MKTLGQFSGLGCYSNDLVLAQLCRQLRDGSGGGGGRGRGRVGVLLLTEQRHLLLEDPHSLLYKWFMQVSFTLQCARYYGNIALFE